jgi:16S rRNA G966 N2-methylase RsmD
MKVTGGVLKDFVIKEREGITRDDFYLSDEFREELFNFIPEKIITNAHTLDISAENGILGIEALSRGAADCDFVEKNPDSSQIIRQNLANTNLLSKGRIFTLPEEDFVKKLLAKYNLIFYNSAGKILDFYIVENLVKHLAAKGYFVVVYSYRVILPYTIKTAKIIQTWQPNEIKVSIFQNQ